MYTHWSPLELRNSGGVHWSWRFGGVGGVPTEKRPPQRLLSCRFNNKLEYMSSQIRMKYKNTDIGVCKK